MSKSGSPSGAGHPLERQDSSGVMDSLECLPDEIVVLIPGQRPPALCALMATCSRFRVLASDEAIWQACHEGRWTYGRPSKPPACGWRVDFRRRHRQDTAVLPLVSPQHMSQLLHPCMMDEWTFRFFNWFNWFKM